MNSSDYSVSVSQQQDFPEAVFEVVVTSPNNSKSQHLVSLSRHFFEEITNGAASPETLIVQSFYFLLEREPQESILSQFELPVIGKYFPEYKATILKDIGHL